MNAPLLACDRARIDVAGAPLLECLSLETCAERVALIGAPGAIFRLLAGQAQLAGGSVHVAGLEPRRAIEQAELGLALGDSELPADYRVHEYLELAARLAGQHRAQARAHGQALLEGLGLSSLAGRRCRELVTAEQRVLLLAQALIGSPGVLAASQLFHGLTPTEHRFVAERLGQALASGRRLLLGIEGYAPDVLDRPLLGGLDEIIVVGRGSVLVQGTPEEVLRPALRYRLTVLRRAAGLAEGLLARGVRVTRGPSAPDPTRNVAAQLVIELPDGITPEVVLEVAIEAEAVVLELIPLSLAGTAPGSSAPPS